MPSAARKSARLLSAPKMLVLLAVVLLITSRSEAFSTRSTASAPTSSKIIQSRTSVPSARRSRYSLVVTSTPLYPYSPLTTTASAATTSGEDENEKRSITPSESEASKDVNDNNIDDDAKELTASSTTSAAAAAGLDRVFNAVDVDGSGALDLEEFERHLAPAGYSRDAIQLFFDETDSDNNGEISRDEFRRAVLGTSSRTASCEEVMDKIDIVDDCPRGYFLNSVKQTCVPLGIIGRISQKVEMMAPFQQTYKRISNLFGVDRKQISKLGVSFALSYSIISNLNGAISFSIAWYMSCKRVSLLWYQCYFFVHFVCFPFLTQLCYPLNSIFIKSTDRVVPACARTMENIIDIVRDDLWRHPDLPTLPSGHGNRDVQTLCGVFGDDAVET